MLCFFSVLKCLIASNCFIDKLGGERHSPELRGNTKQLIVGRDNESRDQPKAGAKSSGGKIRGCEESSLKRISNT